VKRVVVSDRPAGKTRALRAPAAAKKRSTLKAPASVAEKTEETTETDSDTIAANGPAESKSGVSDEPEEVKAKVCTTLSAVEYSGVHRV